MTNQGSLGFPRQWPGHCHAIDALLSGIIWLRVGEFTVPCESGFDPSSNLSWGDLAMDVPGHPSVMSVRLKASKTRPLPERHYTFHQLNPVPGVGHAALPVSVGQTGRPLVPVPGR